MHIQQIYNAEKNSCNKVKKSNEIEKGQKALTPASVKDFGCYNQSLISGIETGHCLHPILKFC